MYFGRTKNKKQNPYTFTEMYKDYKESCKDNDLYLVEYSIYRELCEEYYNEVAERLLQGEFIKLQVGLGLFHVYKKKTKLSAKKLAPDWASTVKYGKIVYHTNEHSRKYSFRLYWNKHSSLIQHLDLYSFTFCRAVKRRLAKYIKEGLYDYFEKK